MIRLLQNTTKEIFRYYKMKTLLLGLLGWFLGGAVDSLRCPGFELEARSIPLFCSRIGGRKFAPHGAIGGMALNLQFRAPLISSPRFSTVLRFLVSVLSLLVFECPLKFIFLYLVVSHPPRIQTLLRTPRIGQILSWRTGPARSTKSLA